MHPPGVVKRRGGAWQRWRRSLCGLLARVVDLDLFVDVVEDGFHLVLQPIQLTSFPLQPPLVLLVVPLQLCGEQRRGFVTVWTWAVVSQNTMDGWIDRSIKSIKTHLLASAACSGRLSAALWLRPGGSRLVSSLPSQPWPSCRRAAEPRGTYPSAGRPESARRDTEEVFLQQLSRP